LTTTTYAYDALSRLIEKSYSDGSGPVFYGYDSASVTFEPVPANSALKVVATLTNSKGRQAWTCREPAAQNSCTTQDAYSYNPLGQVIQRWSSTPAYVASAAPVRIQAYGFDWLGNPLTASDGAGVTTSYTYSPANEVQSISSSLNDATHPAHLLSNVLNGPNGPISYNLGNGLSQYNGYDSLGRRNGGWVCVGAPSLACANQRYGFSAGWRGTQLKSSSDTVMGQGLTYGYDNFNRLTSMTNGSGQQLYGYSYDRYGNRWAQNPLQGGYSFSQSYNPATNRINAGTVFTYDAAGNLTSDGSNAYTYDAEGNLIQQMGSGVTAKFTYDALNEQVRTDQSAPTYSVATENVFNTSGQLASLWEVGGGQLLGKAYWGGTPIESYVPSKNMAYFQYRDWTGSERGITDATGTSTGVRSSLPFGDGAAMISGSRDSTYDGFTGLWDGGSSATNHAPYREYWNNAGRWLQPDPYDGSYDFSNPQSLNRYSYVGGNPLAFTDPSGKDGCLAAIVGGAEGGPITEGISLGVCAAELFGAGNLLNDLIGLFSGPSFHGSLTPRPQSTGVPDWGNDPGSFGESLGIGNGIKTGTWGITSALGLPDAGCEFGACDGGLSSFTSAPAPAISPLDWCETSRFCQLLGEAAGTLESALGASAVLLTMEGDNASTKGPWTCTASCNLQGIGTNTPPISRVTGTASGSSEANACVNAKRVATQSAPR
jgi:RHS repeat-associated protein